MSINNITNIYLYDNYFPLIVCACTIPYKQLVNIIFSPFEVSWWGTVHGNYMTLVHVPGIYDRFSLLRWCVVVFYLLVMQRLFWVVAQSSDYIICSSLWHPVGVYLINPCWHWLSFCTSSMLSSCKFCLVHLLDIVVHELISFCQHKRQYLC